MNWQYLNTGFKDGRSNMNLDIQLAQNCLPSKAFFRLYRWKPFCISLGSNQDIDSVNIIKAAEDGIDFVKRPTGGRAILHSEELTYSIVYPLIENLSLKNLYFRINSALLMGLRIYDDRLGEACLENIEPDFNSFYKKDISKICFGVSAKSEIKYRNKKLVGSAQRKFKNAVLQHGSILCGSYHKNIVRYLNFENDSAGMEEEINLKTTDLQEILNREVDYSALSDSLKDGFESFFQCRFVDPEKVNIRPQQEFNLNNNKMNLL